MASSSSKEERKCTPHGHGRSKDDSLESEGEDYITVETYGYFWHGGQGTRSAAVPIGSIRNWNHFLLQIWNDFQPQDVQLVWINPGIDNKRKKYALVSDGTAPKNDCRLLDHHQQETESLLDELQPDDPQEGDTQDLGPILTIEGLDEIRYDLVGSSDGHEGGTHLVMYGLFQTSIGTRHATSDLDPGSFKAAVIQAWEDILIPGTSGHIYFVKPQERLESNEVHLIVEFSNQHVALPREDVPTLRRITWHNIWEGAEPRAEYNPPSKQPI